eukprot:4798826-Karenia_brevis.AAC.1
MNPVGNDDCGKGDITPDTTSSEPLRQTCWGHGAYNMVSNHKDCNTQTPMPSQQGALGEFEVVEDDVNCPGRGICP